MVSKRRPPNPTENSSQPFWVLLGLLTLTNFLIGYSPLPTWLKAFLFLMGVILPLVLWAKRGTFPKPGARPFDRTGFLTSFPLWLGVLLLVLAVGIRFWKVDSLFHWPLGDEVSIALSSKELAQEWDWRFFFTSGQNPPGLIWLGAPFFKWLPDPFLALWLPPALISCCTLGLGYLAAKQFFSRSFAWLCCGVLAFSYWPLFMGRIDHPGLLMPPGELALLWALGNYRHADNGRKGPWAFLTGLLGGLQSLTFVSWPVVTLAGGFLFWKFTGPKERVKNLAPFVVGLILGLLPFLMGVVHQGFGGHILESAAWNTTAGWKRALDVAVNYVSVLGWGVFHQEGFYRPEWGGFLNPLLTSLFLLGMVQLWKGFSSLGRWFIGVFILFLVPGFLSLNVEGFRIAPLLPLLAMLVAFGAELLLKMIPQDRKVLCVVTLFLLSVGFDFTRLTLPYWNVEENPQLFAATGRSLARYRAYGLMKELVEKKGPGIVLGEWDLAADRTLRLATYPFNAAENPKLDPGRAQWLAVVLDAHYRPFLRKRFPEGQWKDLDSDFAPQGNRDLFILPVTPSNGPVAYRWAKADQAFRDLNGTMDRINDRDALTLMDQAIHRDYPLIQGDPFLESCFWEKIANFYYFEGHHFAEHLKAAELAVQRGYPAAHLYRKLYELRLLAGDPAGAQAVFKKLRLPGAK